VATDPAVDNHPDQKPSTHRPTEEEVDMRATVPQRTDRKGTKIEDLAGTGEQDSPGG
jgi:hypothetical protein